MTRGSASAACLLLSAFAASFAACGARTEVDIAGDGLAGSSGAPIAGAPAAIAGAPAAGGAPSFAGMPTAAGASSGGGAHAGGPSVGGAPSGAAGFAGTGATSSGGFSGSAGAGGASNVIVDACVAIAQTSCNKCLCQVCSSAFIGCFSDIGCAAIFGCIAKTGCQGFDCYGSDTCRSVIKQYGGLTGNAATEVFALASCSLSSQNVCACN